MQTITTIIKLCSLSIILLTLGCNETDKKGEMSRASYYAINKLDTATFNIKFTDKEFYGQLEINYRGAYKDSGGVTGIIKGDTLKGSYRYQHYGMEKWHRMPIVMLKKDNKLLMGVGLTEVYMNILYFKKNRPIDYSHPRFIFEKIDSH